MKNRILKALASFGLSVCVLAGSSVVSMAEETPGKTECKEHTLSLIHILRAHET